MAGPLMGLGHFNHPVIGELLWLSIVNKFSNLKMNSSMGKNVYLTCLHFSSVELAPPYQVLDVDIQLSCGLLPCLLDVTKVLLSGLPIGRTLFKAISECSEYLVWWLAVFSWHLFLQGLPSISCLGAPKEENCVDLRLLWCVSHCVSRFILVVKCSHACPQRANPSWEACLVVLECWPLFPQFIVDISLSEGVMVLKWESLQGSLKCFKWLNTWWACAGDCTVPAY